MTEARIVLTGVGGTPVRATAAEALLAGATVNQRHQVEPEALGAALDALRSAIDPATDVQATAAYRRHLAGVLAERALRTACERAHP